MKRLTEELNNIRAMMGLTESDKYDYKVVSYDDFNDMALDLATLDLEDDQVRLPKFNEETDNYILQIGYNYLYIRNRDALPNSGAYELFILDGDDEQIGFIRGTKKDNIISFNLIYIMPEARGKGIGSDIYEYFLNNGFIVRSDSEITDSTYGLYTKLAKHGGYTPIIFNDNRVGLTKSNLNENLITERLTDVEEDVDFIYDKFFKEDIDEIQRTGIVTTDMFKIHETDSNILKSKVAREANLSTLKKFKKPITIYINKKFSHGFDNFYNYKDNIISIGISRDALEYALDHHRGDIQKAADGLPLKLKVTFKQQFTEEKIKGSIHHELAHWIDQTFNNDAVSRSVNRYNLMVNKKKRHKNAPEGSGTDINFEYMERQGQIHNIKQLYNKHKDRWDKLTFKGMLELSPALDKVYYTMGDKNLRDKWVRLIKQRMYREGLLGKNMFDK